MWNDDSLTTRGEFQWAPATGRWRSIAPTLVVTFLLLAAPAVAQEQPSPGQQDLDNATLAKLSAQSAADLEAVSELCESALAKGLDEGNQAYARELLKSTLYEQAALLSRLIFDQQPVDPRWQRIREVCLSKLQRALEIDPNMGNSNLLWARLQALPGGDRGAAKQALAKAINQLADDPELLSAAYQTRAGLTEDPKQAIEDLNRAIELYPRNLAAWRARGVAYLTQEEYDKAIEDFNELLERDPDDPMAHQAIAQTLRHLGKLDEARQHLDKALETNPNSALAYHLKARIDEEEGNLAAALENMNEALRVAPDDLPSLLYRARLLTAQDQFDLAREDVRQALQRRPGLPEAILLQSVIAAAQGQIGEAIGHLNELLKQQPDNSEIKLQIAALLEADRRPRKAIEIYSELIAADPDNWMALRRRADAYLSTAEHAKAIADYEAALQHATDEPGILNNFAWVLATSPHDHLRDGERSVELATKACELTEYKAAHILSTLAAGYAEQGKFDEAVKWSNKAVELDKDEPQLTKELEAYRAGKPWREEQNVAENPEPLGSSPNSPADSTEETDSDATEPEPEDSDNDDPTAPVFDDVPELDLDFDDESPGR